MGWERKCGFGIVSSSGIVHFATRRWSNVSVLKLVIMRLVYRILSVVVVARTLSGATVLIFWGGRTIIL